MSVAESLAEACERGVEYAQGFGADESEVSAQAVETCEVGLQKDDLQNAATAEETTFGVRVFCDGALGFATVNGAAALEDACRDAVAIARATPGSEGNGLAEPRPVPPFERGLDPALATLDVSSLVEHAVGLLDRVKAMDARVRIDSGGVYVRRSARAIATSLGTRLCEAQSSAGGGLFGMAVDGDDVGSFDYDGAVVLDEPGFAPALDALVDRFVGKCVGALGAKRGESFRGTVILSPEVVRSFLLSDLLGALNAKAVRTGRSRLGDQLGKSIAVAELTLIDDGRTPEGAASCAFDREGIPTREHVLVDRGVLGGFLYDVFEARAAGVEPTGSARGGAGQLPSIGPHNLRVAPGTTPLATLCAEPERAVLVTRFSGSSSPISGEFSGVVKGGFLLRRGERIPIRETLIAGNLFDALRSISGLSQEIFELQASAWVPAIRVEAVSVTSG